MQALELANGLEDASERVRISHGIPAGTRTLPSDRTMHAANSDLYRV
jgi:hypothetical protein